VDASVSGDERDTPAADDEQACALTLGVLLLSMAEAGAKPAARWRGGPG
jgi:hypothetical protein